MALMAAVACLHSAALAPLAARAATSWCVVFRATSEDVAPSCVGYHTGCMIAFVDDCTGMAQMARGDNLGEFEQLVLLALLSLEQDEAYGMTVRSTLRELAGRNVAVPTVYSALDRLENKGHVTATMGEATPERGGRAKKLFEVTPSGLAELKKTRRILDRMWEAASLEPEPL